MQVTQDEEGHCLYNIQCFSPDDQWIVFDTRNDDTHIGRTGSIKLLNTKTYEIVEVYRTSNQSLFGPGVGAACFSPVRDRVLFIHGIRNADKSSPYGFTRRTGVAIDTRSPFLPIFMDARNITSPFTPGALRGGTHAYSWSGDGQWISFTYNDYIIEQLGRIDPLVADLRTIGVMRPGRVEVPADTGNENNSGEMFSVVAAKVTEYPRPGSDEISRAFDESWIGKNGYLKKNGEWQEKAIAFQGQVKNTDGTDKLEVFVVDLPAEWKELSPEYPLEGTLSTRPNIPAGLAQRRITYTGNGIIAPRHWLRTSADGTMIAFLSTDEKGIVQVFAVSPNGGDIKQLTFGEYAIQGQFNFSPDGSRLAYITSNGVYITDIRNRRSQQVTPAFPADEPAVGAVIWSNRADMITFNRYIRNTRTGNNFLQICLMNVPAL